MNTRDVHPPMGKGQMDRAGGADTSRDAGVLKTVRDAAQNVAAGASSIAGRVQETAESWAATAGEAAGTAKDAVYDAAGSVADCAGDFGATVTKTIRQYPLQAVLVGFGIGFLLGQMRPRS
jgi:hypothetical protein